MNWDRVEGNWKQYRGKVRQEWDRLTDRELDLIAGRRERLMQRLQDLYAITGAEAERQIRAWERKHPDFEDTIKQRKPDRIDNF